MTPTSFLITNLGRSDAGAFGVLISSGWLRASCNGRVPELRTVQGAGLAAGQSVTLSLSSFPSSTPRKVIVDFQHEVRESNERNNTAVIPPAQTVC